MKLNKQTRKHTTESRQFSLKLQDEFSNFISRVLSADELTTLNIWRENVDFWL